MDENCFLCSSKIIKIKVKKPKPVKGRKRFKQNSDAINEESTDCSTAAAADDKGRKHKGLELLLKYLLDTPDKQFDKLRDEIFKKTQMTQSVLEFGPDGEFQKEVEGESSGPLLTVCRKCEKVVDNVLNLQLELETVQMKIIHQLKSVKECILKSSTRLGVGKASDSEILSTFHQAVDQKGSTSIEVPLLILERYAYCPKEELLDPNDIKVKVEVDESVPWLELEESLPMDLELPHSSTFTSAPEFQFTGEAVIPKEEVEETMIESNAIPKLRVSSREKRPAQRMQFDRHVRVKNPLRIEANRERKKILNQIKKDPKKKCLLKPKRLKSVRAKFSCDTCGRLHKIKGYFQFEDHMRKHETDEKNFQCDQCSASFTQHLYFLQHQHRHFKEKMKCDICNEKVCVPDMLEHLKTSHPELTPIPCMKCSFYCGDRMKFIKHLLKTHKGTGYVCDICSQQFSSRHALFKHWADFHEVIEPLKCDFEGCESTFVNPTMLTHHKTQHTKATPYCPECQKTFQSQNAITIHQQRCHTDELSKPFYCGLCKKGFITLYEKETHFERYHSEPTKCDYCEKLFRDRTSLRSHKIKYHSDKGDFGGKKCPVCRALFVNSSRLKNHMEVHSEIRKYVCEQCGKSFKTQHGRKTHMKFHRTTKDYLCPHCPKAFRLKEWLVTHIRTHTGDRPYACSCGKAFSQSGSRKIHRRKCKHFLLHGNQQLPPSAETETEINNIQQQQEPKQQASAATSSSGDVNVLNTNPVILDLDNPNNVRTDEGNVIINNDAFSLLPPQPCLD